METNNPPSKKRPWDSWSKRKRIAIALSIVLAFGVTALSLLALDYSTCPLVILVPDGTSLSISPASHIDYSFSVTKVVWGPNRPLWGSLSADNTITMYIMTISQFTNFNATGTPTSYVWASGSVTSVNWECGYKSCIINNQPGAPLGSYYFVINNPSSSVLANVSVNQRVELGSC